MEEGGEAAQPTPSGECVIERGGEEGGEWTSGDVRTRKDPHTHAVLCVYTKEQLPCGGEGGNTHNIR